MNIKVPPAVQANPFAILTKSEPDKLEQYLEFYNPMDKKGRYLPYDELRHRIANGLDHKLAWSLTKLSRIRQQIPSRDVPLSSVRTYPSKPVDSVSMV